MNENLPLISVIVPTHNSEKYIDRCLGSILNQSEKRFEILVVDDQSADDTRARLKTFEDRYECIRVFQTPTRMMAGGSRNIGLEEATGKFVCFIDSDDWIDTDFFKRMNQSIERNQSQVVICGIKNEYSNARESCVRYQYNEQNVISGTYALQLLSRAIDQDISISSIPTNKMYSVHFLKQHGIKFLPNSINEDDVFMFRVFMDAKCISIENSTYYHYFQRPNSISRQFSSKSITDLMEAFQALRKILEGRDEFVSHKLQFYSFFEKCLRYVLENMRLSVQDEDEANAYLLLAYETCSKAVVVNEFIKHCGHRRICRFFE